MPIIYADRVQESTTSTGTGVIALGGATLGFRTFLSGVGLGNQSYYAITDAVSGDWEVGLGTLGVGTFSRDLVLSSSNANMLVSFVAGTKAIFTVSPATFFSGTLLTANHGTTNHTGIPGVPAAEAFTAGVHASTSHTGLPGVGNLATAPGAGLVDHATVNHAGLPGVPAAETFTAGVHATTDHTGITGAGLTTKQLLIWPASMPHQYWAPNSDVGTFGASFLPSSTGGDAEFSDMTIDNDGGSTPTHLFTTVVGLGPVRQYTFPFLGTKLRMQSTAVLLNLLPRLVLKAKLTTSTSFTFQVGIGSSLAGNFFSQVNAVFVQQTGTSAWTIERRVSAATKTSTPTGIAGATAIYVLFNYISTTSVTVTFYDATTFAVLFTTTFSGAAEVPAPSSVDRVRLYADGGGGAVLQLSSILLSFNEA